MKNIERIELLAPLYDDCKDILPTSFEGWELIPGYIDQKHVCTAILKGNEIHFGIKKEFRKKFTTDPSSWFMLDDPKYDKKDEDPAVWTEKEDKKLAVYYDVLNKAQHNYGSMYGAFCINKRFKDERHKILSYFRDYTAMNIEVYLD